MAPASLMSAPAVKAEAAPFAKVSAPKAPKAEAKPAAKVVDEAPSAPKAADKPKGLDTARGGKADDLKMIKGIGPKLEILCNKLGFFHFDQIAAWTSKEIAWVDDNLEGFKGRVTRDEWVKQAAVLAKGGTTEFANRVKDGGVY
jgi:NADH-quinone oxidoreductase subunit E